MRKIMMNTNENLMQFIDAVIANDDEARKIAFSAHTEQKTKEILGVPVVTPVAEAVDVNEVKLDGNDVMFGGKKVGTIEPNANDKAKSKFVGTDGTTATVDLDDVSKMMEMLRAKYAKGDTA